MDPELRELGDNTGSMALKGANPDHEGEARPDRWAMSDRITSIVSPARKRRPHWIASSLPARMSSAV